MSYEFDIILHFQKRSNVSSIGNKGTGEGAKATAGIYGYSLSNSNFVNCLVNDNSNNVLDSIAGADFYGFLFEKSSNNSIMKCKVNNNKGIFLGVGIAMLDASSNNTVEECEVINTIARACGKVYGILCQDSLGIKIKQCYVWGGQTPEMGEDGFAINASVTSGYDEAYGIAFDGVVSGAIENCTIGANRVSLRNTDTPYDGTHAGSYGIALLNQCERTDVKSNTIHYNSGRDFGYGFYDDAIPTTSFLRGNVVYGHGVAYNPGAQTSTGDKEFSNFYFHYSGSVGSITESNTILSNSSSETDTWQNYSIN